MKRFRTLISLVLIVCLCQGMLFTVNAETSESPLDTWETNLSTINSILSGRMVMVIDSPKYFLDGTASHYDNSSDEAMSKIYPVERGTSAIVPAKAVAQEFGYSLSVDGNTGTFTRRTTTIVMTAGSTAYTKNGSSYTAEVAPEIINGVFYVPIKAFVSAIGWSLYTDLEDTGLMIIGEDSTPFNTTAKAAVKSEIARATRYERPDAATVIADMEAFQNARIAKGDRPHPRIHITDSRIEDLKTQIAEDEFTAKIYNGIKEAALSNYNVADSSSTVDGVSVPAIKDGIPQYSEYYGNQIGRIDWHTWIEDMMLVYWLEGESDDYEHYLQRSKDILLSVAQWPDYGTYQSLSTSDASISLSVGYDWLYNYLTDSEKEIVKTAIVEKCMRPDLTRYNYTIDGSTPIFHRWPTWGNNFTSKGNEGVSHAIVAVWDEGDEERGLATEMLRYMFRSQELALDFLLPDGGGNEGLSYLLGGSVSESAGAFLNIINATGKNYGYLQSRSFKDALENLVYMTGAEGLYSFGDEDWRPRGKHEPKEILPLLFWMGKNISPIVYNYRKDVLENYLDSFNTWRNADYTAYDLLYYDTDFVPEEQELALGKYYRGTEYIGVRESWDTIPDRVYPGGYVYKDSFLGFKGGLGSGTHTHHDMGSFIWDDNGVRWFGDHGRNIDAYNSTGTVYHDAVYTYRAEGHNVLMFRNADDITNIGTPETFDGKSYYLYKGDDFETTNVGAAPNWETSINGDSIIEVVEDSDSKHGNVLRMTANSATKDSRIYTTFNPYNITDNMIVEYDIKVNKYEDSGYAQFLGLYLEDSNEENLGWKQFDQIDDTKFYRLTPYTDGQWYSMKTVFDFANGTYTHYINEEEIGEYEIKHDNAHITGVCASSLVFSTMGSTTLDCYLDNIKIYVDESNSESVREKKKLTSDQSTATDSKITKFVNSPSSAFGIADLSEVYPDYSRNYKRGAGLFGNREYLVIRDEAVVAKDCESYWFGHTLANIELVDGKNAILTDAATGKRAWVGIVSDGDETFSLRPATRFPETSGMYDNFENVFKNKNKLTIASNRTAGERIELTVMMKALDDGEAMPTYDILPDVKSLSLSEWSADNTPLVHGNFVAGAEEGVYTLNGNVTTANGGKILPVIAAYDDDTNELLDVALFNDEKDLNANLPRDLSFGIKIPDAKLEKGGKVTLKAFIWDGVEKLTPYTTFFEKKLDLPAKVVPVAEEIPAE